MSRSEAPQGDAFSIMRPDGGAGTSKRHNMTDRQPKPEFLERAAKCIPSTVVRALHGHEVQCLIDDIRTLSIRFVALALEDEHAAGYRKAIEEIVDAQDDFGKRWEAALARQKAWEESKSPAVEELVRAAETLLADARVMHSPMGDLMMNVQMRFIEGLKAAISALRAQSEGVGR